MSSSPYLKSIFTLYLLKFSELTTFEKRREKAFTEGFHDWNDGKRKMQVHESSKSHHESVSALNSYDSAKVNEMLSANIKKSKRENNVMLTYVIDVIRHLARQNLALRGATTKQTADQITSEPNGNMWQTLTLVSKYSPDLSSLMRKKQNFTSPSIQNELMQLMASRVIRKLAEDVRSAMCYSIMVDETTDCTNREQAVFCLR